MPLEQLASEHVYKRLSSLRVALRGNLVGRGLALVIIAAVTAVFFSFVVDRQLDMSLSQRVLIMTIVLAAVGYVAWRFVLRPLRVPMNSTELALVLEKHYPELNDRLISTLEFSGADVAEVGASEALVRKVAEQANALADGLDPRAPVESRETTKRLCVALGAMVILAVFSYVKADVMVPWFMRNILFRNVPYPQQTYLKVTCAPGLKVPRGGSLTVTVTADPEHIVPREVVFHTRFTSLAGTQRDRISQEGDSNEFTRTFEDITEPFKFRITGNDDTTEWFAVRIVDPPQLVGLNFTITYPEYMENRSTATVSAERGELALPAGSTIKLEGKANKDLRAGRLWLEDKNVGVVVVSDDDPRAIRGSVKLPKKPGKSMLILRIELTDTEDITNPRGAEYGIRIEADGAPAVQLGRKGVRGEITAKAMIPLVIGVRDDHGVIAVEAKLETMAAPEASTQPAEGAPATPTKVIKRTFPVPGIPTRPRKAELTVEYGLDIRPLKLSVGQRVSVRAAATDTLPELFGGPNRGVSAVHTFRIVSEEDLLMELLRRQKEIRDVYSRAVELQATTRDRVLAVKDQLDAVEVIDVEVRRKLKLAASDQLRIATQCADTARQMQSVLDEIAANRVGTDAQIHNLSTRIISPLEEISKKPMSDVAALLSSASKKTDAAELRELAESHGGTLDAFHTRLEDVLKQMEKEQSRQELVRMLQKILSDSKTLKDWIEEYLKGEMDKLGGENSK